MELSAADDAYIKLAENVHVDSGKRHDFNYVAHKLFSLSFTYFYTYPAINNLLLYLHITQVFI